MNPEKNKEDAQTSKPDTEQSYNSQLPKDLPVTKKLPWKKIVVIFALIIFSVFLLGYLLLYIGLSGGIGGVLNDLKSPPDPNNSEVISKRNEAVSSIQSSFDQIDSSIDFTNYAVATHDKCYEGQNNWKVKDGYAHKCAYKITKFYGFNDDFRQEMTEFDQMLTDNNWQPPRGLTMDKILTQYYDQYYGPDNPKPRNFSESYLVSDLPVPINYTRDNQILEIEYAERKTEILYSLENIQRISSGGFSVFEKKDFQNIYSLFNTITEDNEFIFAISIQENYFEN